VGLERDAALLLARVEKNKCVVALRGEERLALRCICILWHSSVHVDIRNDWSGERKQMKELRKIEGGKGRKEERKK
jgi:hypothetical protein